MLSGSYFAVEKSYRGCERWYPADASRVTHRRVNFELGEKRDGHGEQQEYQCDKFDRVRGLRENGQNLGTFRVVRRAKAYIVIAASPLFVARRGPNNARESCFI